jgi:hypothetical protein
MESDDRDRPEPARASPDGYRYAIRVQGHLDAHWSEWLEGMTQHFPVDPFGGLHANSSASRKHRRSATSRDDRRPPDHLRIYLPNVSIGT